MYLLSAIQGCQSLAELLVERSDLRAARLVMLFKKPERLAHDLAGRVVAARSDLTGDELFKFRGEGDVHEGEPPTSMLTRITHFVNFEHYPIMIYSFRGSMAGLQSPLPTLRPAPRGAQRMTLGQCGLLFLHYTGFAPATPYRSPGALAVSNF